MTMVSLPARYFRPFVAAVGLIALIAGPADAEQASSSPLQLELKIFLGDVEGRIDHLAIDLSRKRLFVAELGNGTVDVVDLEDHRVVHTIGGLKEPQGVAYIGDQDVIIVASAGDGAVRFFRADDLSPLGTVDLGNNANNVRIDPVTRQALVGCVSACKFDPLGGVIGVQF